MSASDRGAKGDVIDPDRVAAARAAAALVRAERRMIACDLHRTPIQLLAAASLRMQLAASEAGQSGMPGLAAREIDAAISALRDLMERLASSDVEPEVLADALGLVAGTRPEGPGETVSIEEAAALVVAAAAAAPAPEPSTEITSASTR